MHLAELRQILKQKPARLPAHDMKGYAALIEPSELNWGEAKLSRCDCNSSTCTGVIARHEHDLPLPLDDWIRSKLFRR